MLRIWFLSLAQSTLGQYMQTSKWGFAVVEAIHLLALAILGGAVLIQDLRLMGLVFKEEPMRRINRDMGRTLLGSLVIMVLSGIALVSEEALKCYYNPAFRWKMVLLVAAIVFYFTLHRSAINRSAEESRVGDRIIGAISIFLWLGVGVAGRAIGLI
jgi:uncharacterized protein DUF6644